ncbi:MAG: PorP/SprF family type IX secretion system membrane protein [Bacteroidia bacterium]|nr:PorP/SprF family type IX secretion system membrane protein [Bacteroidia bacterium]
MYLFFVLGMVSESFGQDAEFTQFNSVPQYINPAFAGAGPTIHRFAGAYRNQWPGVERGFSSYLASYDGSLVKYNAGAGLYFLQDQAGSSYLTNTQMGLNLAYAFDIDRNFKLRAGLQACFNQKKYQVSRLIFNDQLITNSPTSLDGNGPASPMQFFDVGSGLLLDSKLMWFGVSARHLNQPDQSLLGKGSVLPMLISAHGGYRYEIVKPEKPEDVSPHSVGGLLHYRHQGINDQLDIGVAYFFKMINFTVWYRGIPFKTYKDYSNSESIAFLLGFEPIGKGFKVGYSYDYTISSLSSKTTAGAHELTLGYEIGSKGPAKRKSRKAIGGTMKF